LFNKLPAIAGGFVILPVMSDIAIECSPFFNQLAGRHPDWLEELRESGRLDTTSPPQPETLQQTIENTSLDAGLRQFRNCEMMRLTRGTGGRNPFGFKHAGGCLP
jgi:hypothetical protein